MRESIAGTKARGPRGRLPAPRIGSRKARWARSSTPVFALAALFSLAAFVSPTSAAGPLNAEEQAARTEAIRAIPFDKLEPPAQQRLSAIINDTSVFRRLPVQAIESDADMYLFLVRHPDVVVNIWQLMGISNVTVRRIAPYTFDASDGMGTVAKVDLVYGDRETHVFLAEGHYEGPLFRRKLTGRCVAVLRSGFDQPQQGRPIVAGRMDVFLQVDSAGLELLAKTLHPLLGKTADTNFVETMKFLSQVSGAAEKNGPGVEQLAAKLTNVDGETRDRFARVATAAYDRSMLRTAQLGGRILPTPSTPATAAAPIVQVREDGVYITDLADEPAATSPPATPIIRSSGPMFRR